MNVGAEAPEDYGLYFAWGETVGYGSDTSDGRLFDYASYKWINEGESSWQQINKYQREDGQTEACWSTYGNYWSSTVAPSASDYARGLYFLSIDISTSSSYRYYGQCIRPVQ